MFVAEHKHIMLKPFPLVPVHFVLLADLSLFDGAADVELRVAVVVVAGKSDTRVKIWVSLTKNAHAFVVLIWRDRSYYFALNAVGPRFLLFIVLKPNFLDPVDTGQMDPLRFF